MSAVFKVDRAGYLSVVTKDGDVVWGPGYVAHAEEKRDELERQERRKPRACMTCGTEFLSEWSGHRMCARCRSGATDIFDGAV